MSANETPRTPQDVEDCAASLQRYELEYSKENAEFTEVWQAAIYLRKLQAELTATRAEAEALRTMVKENMDAANGAIGSEAEFKYAIRAALSDPQIRREVGGWRPIESAPKDGTAILLLYKGHAVEALWECVDSGDGESGKQPAYRWSSEFDFFGYGTEPTHWMPLPEPPEGK